MHFGDYDHDGRATEFLLLSQTFPCGHPHGFVVGVSKNNRQLHAFGTGSKPNQTLYCDTGVWWALLRATAPIEVVSWHCVDHAAQEETKLLLRWTERGIEGARRWYTCPSGNETQSLSREEPL
jgi:hypothetical protein